MMPTMTTGQRLLVAAIVVAIVSLAACAPTSLPGLDACARPTEDQPAPPPPRASDRCPHVPAAPRPRRRRRRRRHRATRQSPAAGPSSSPPPAPTRAASPASRSRFPATTSRGRPDLGGDATPSTRPPGRGRGRTSPLTGGPGSSGISVADSYTDAFPEGVEDSYDIVFLDQRGIGLSGPFQCPIATGAYYASAARAQDPDEATAAGPRRPRT